MYSSGGLEGEIERFSRARQNIKDESAIRTSSINIECFFLRLEMLWNMDYWTHTMVDVYSGRLYSIAGCWMASYLTS